MRRNCYNRCETKTERVHTYTHNEREELYNCYPLPKLLCDTLHVRING